MGEIANLPNLYAILTDDTPNQLREGGGLLTRFVQIGLSSSSKQSVCHFSRIPTHLVRVLRARGSIVDRAGSAKPPTLDCEAVGASSAHAGSV